MSKSHFVILSLVFSFLWAGAAGCGGPSKTIVSASIAIPFDLLEISSYEAQLTLADSATGSVLQGPIALVKDEANSVWTAELQEIDDQNFQATVDIVVPDAPDSNGPLVIATASREISIPKGSAFATLTFKPSDFSTEIDDDRDTVFNISEYLNGSNPRGGEE